VSIIFIHILDVKFSVFAENAYTKHAQIIEFIFRICAQMMAYVEGKHKWYAVPCSIAHNAGRKCQTPTHALAGRDSCVDRAARGFDCSVRSQRTKGNPRPKSWTRDTRAHNRTMASVRIVTLNLLNPISPTAGTVLAAAVWVLRSINPENSVWSRLKFQPCGGCGTSSYLEHITNIHI